MLFMFSYEILIITSQLAHDMHVLSGNGVM